jgi:RimJ/RimL family protein N-acetyltransferase
MGDFTLGFREPVAGDSDFLFDLRNEAEARAMSRDTEPLNRSTHERWLAETLVSDQRVLYVVEKDGDRVGTLRFDVRGTEAELSILLVPEARGGTGWRVINEGTDQFLTAHPYITRVIGDVREENARTFGLARKTGRWRLTDEVRTPGFVIFELAPEYLPASGKPARGG